MFSKDIWVENAGDGAAFAVWVTGQYWKGEPMQQKILWGDMHWVRWWSRVSDSRAIVPGMVY